jgi:hypothetical protein
MARLHPVPASFASPGAEHGEHRTPNIEHRTSNTEHPTPDIEVRERRKANEWGQANED